MTWIGSCPPEVKPPTAYDSHSRQRAAGLVDQILTFSRRSEQERKPVELNPLVKEVLKLLRASTPSTIQIASDVSSSPITVQGVPEKGADVYRDRFDKVAALGGTVS